jgi:hypothetical protein
MESHSAASLSSQAFQPDHKSEDASDVTDDPAVRSESAVHLPTRLSVQGLDAHEKPHDAQTSGTTVNDPHFKVVFEDSDPENPKNWSAVLKAWITLQLGLLALVGSLGSVSVSCRYE